VVLVQQQDLSIDPESIGAEHITAHSPVPQGHATLLSPPDRAPFEVKPL
jgi:hypothetical protein